MEGISSEWPAAENLPLPVSLCYSSERATLTVCHTKMVKGPRAAVGPRNASSRTFLLFERCVTQSRENPPAI
jgi:hypothetical protein